jgi:hypothetical protein
MIALTIVTIVMSARVSARAAAIVTFACMHSNVTCLVTRLVTSLTVVLG